MEISKQEENWTYMQIPLFPIRFESKYGWFYIIYFFYVPEEHFIGENSREKGRVWL